MSTRALLLLCLLLALAGCAGKPPPVPPPPVVLTTATWQRIDQELIEASVGAGSSANDYARRSMRVWKEQVQQRTESDFIPWFTGYWTQQWLTLKVAWYKIDSGEGREPAEKRLALYLQEQYHKRVIEPVAEQINPEGIRDRASELYLQLLGQQLPAIISRYNAPPSSSANASTAFPPSPWGHRMRAMPAFTSCCGPSRWPSNLPGKPCASICTSRPAKARARPMSG